MTARPLRVCFVMPIAHRLGGAEKMLWLFLRDVDRERIAPSAVFLDDGPFRADCDSIGVPQTLIAAGRVREVGPGARTVARLAGHFHRTRPDLIVQWFGKTQIWVAPAASLVGMRSRVVWWQHSVMERRDALARLIDALPARAVGAESAAAADREAAVWPHRPTFVVHSGVDDERRGDTGELRTQTRASLGLGEDELLVGMISRVQRWKGQDRLLRAIATLRDEGIACRGLLVGGDAYGLDPEYNREVAAAISDLGLGEILRWVDQVSDPRPYLHALDVYVNASAGEEIYSLGLLEAMSAGLCIIGVADGGTPEAVTDGESGLLIARSDPDLLTAALRRALADVPLRDRLGRGARETYEARLTAAGWTAAVQERIEILCRPDYREALAAVARNPR